MAKKEKTLLLRNTICDFSCPWCNKLDGSDIHSFVKGEIFEVPEFITRVRNGDEVKVSTKELLENLFPHGIEEAKGALSMAAIKEKDAEIAQLKAELAKTKKQSSKNSDKTEEKSEEVVVDDSKEEK